MRNLILLCLLVTLALGCQKSDNAGKQMHFELEDLAPLKTISDSYKETLYVPIYRDVYHIDQLRLLPLTTTLSLRNMGITDSVYIYCVDHYNTQGKKIRQYMDDKSMLTLGPLESYDLVVVKKDKQGGTGDNFIVQWGRTTGDSQLLVEALMINTTGSQGLSVITEGKIIHQEYLK